MKKTASFFVEARYFILAVFFLLTVLCAFLIPQVNVITDMTQYLPSDSSMRKGLDIMEEEFPNASVDSTVRVMFTNLADDAKSELQTELAKIENIDSVTYDSSEDYNKGEYTLYVLNTSHDYESDEMTEIENALTENFADDYEMTYCMGDTTITSVPPGIIPLALVILMIILFLMCHSWIEPFLFMFTIGTAIIINTGTNAFLSGVSMTTNSIAAILQLVLSMDYSIMLMDRYRQESETTDDRKQAMKNALASSFSSITGSSVTTIVGMLMLVFMSFKIGADMGIVLAKGVLISLICIFTVLPALILGFDKLIKKTAKKPLQIRLNWLGKFSKKCRYVVLGVFIVFFICMILIKGNTPIIYNLIEETDVDKVFTPSNSIIMLYNNDAEENISDFISDLEKEDSVKSVTAFSNTLGKEYSAQELSNQLSAMSDDIALESTMINYIYYLYHSSGKTDPIALPDFLDFLQNDIMKNDMFSSQIDYKSQMQLKMLSSFSSVEELTKQRTGSELALMFGIDGTALEQIFAMSGKSSMSIQEFMQILSTNQTLAASLNSGDAAAAQQMQMIQTLVSGVLQGTEYTADEMAQLFGTMAEGMDKSTMSMLYTFYFSQKDFDETWTMTIPELFDYVTDTLSVKEPYSNFFDSKTKKQLTEAKAELENGINQLTGENYSILMISSELPLESDETTAFMKMLTEKCENELGTDYYLIGNSPMSYEMSQTFDVELNKITLLTAIAIFLVVAVTFRSISIPLILVLIIQAAVYATVVIIGLQGTSMYYLALLIVQSILMGATIDYGILYTTYYREKRQSMDIKEALIEAYNGSIHTILTSGLIIVLITFILGYAFSDPAISQIVHTISKGATCSLVLIIFILPGILAVFDKFVCKKKKAE